MSSRPRPTRLERRGFTADTVRDGVVGPVNITGVG